MKKSIDLTQGKVSAQLLRMTIPMIGGMFAMTAFNLTDTYFVSRLGEESLAAMGFTFPVVMIIASVAFGLAIGTSSCVSRAIGEGNEHSVKRLCTDSLILTVLITGMLAVIGVFVSKRIFIAMGAQGHVLDLVMDYMNVWFLCVAVFFIPMVGNHSIRASGDTTIPSVIMMIAAGLNVGLDPIFIFGWAGIPAMGIRGAAVATVIARALSMVASLCFLHFRYRFIEWSRPSLVELLDSWKSILKMALPASATNMLMPLTMGIVTKIIAGYGDVAVAAVGAANRVQMFCYIIPIALGSTLAPFVGQNWGAARLDRIRQARRVANTFSILYGVGCVLLALLLGKRVGALFGDEPELVQIFALYIVIVFVGSGMQHIAVHAGFCLNAMGKPLIASAYNATRMVGLMVPFAIVGSKVGGLGGTFWGLASAQIAAGLLSFVLLHRVLAGAEDTGLGEAELVED